jgi:hypothetical protein
MTANSPFRPGFVLDQHVQLTSAMLNPTELMVGYIYSFARSPLWNHGDPDLPPELKGPLPPRIETDLRRKTSLTKDDMAMIWWPFKVYENEGAAALWSRDVGKGLQIARAYQVTAKMVDVANKVYGNQSGIFHLEEAELPSRAGFVWLDQPLESTDRWGNLVIERAVSWSPVNISVRYKGLPGQPEENITGIRLATWNWIGDAHRDDYLREDKETRDGLAMLGDLTLSHTFIVPFGERHSFARGKAEHPDGEPGDYKPDSTLAWMHVLWMLMEQEIVTMPQTRPERAARRRASKTLKHSDGISVITLRRLHPVPGEPKATATHIDWQFQWMVQGHHRHIDRYEGDRHHAVPMFGMQRDKCRICLSQGEDVRTTWVKSYLKGPDGMPLKATQTLYKLAR